MDSVSPGTGLNRRAGGAKSGRRCLSVFTLPHFFPVRYARVVYVVVGSVCERKAVCDAARPSAERDTVRAHAVVIVSVATRDGIHRNSASIRPMEAVAERRFTRNEFYLRQIVSMQRNVQIICVGSLFGVSRRRIVQSVVEHRLRNALCTDVVARRRHHCARICGRTVRVLLTGAIRYRVEDSFELALVVVLRAHEIVRVARPQRTDRTLNIDCSSRAGAGRFAVPAPSIVPLTGVRAQSIAVRLADVRWNGHIRRHVVADARQWNGENWDLGMIVSMSVHRDDERIRDESVEALQLERFVIEVRRNAAERHKRRKVRRRTRRRRTRRGTRRRTRRRGTRRRRTRRRGTRIRRRGTRRRRTRRIRHALTETCAWKNRPVMS